MREKNFCCLDLIPPLRGGGREKKGGGSGNRGAIKRHATRMSASSTRGAVQAPRQGSRHPWRAKLHENKKLTG